MIIRSNSSAVDFALLKDGKLIELNKEIEDNKFSVGDIFIAKIRKSVSGLNASFINVGHQKDGFLHYHDLGPKVLSLIKYVKLVSAGKFNNYLLKNFRYENEIEKNGKIEELLKPKQSILVQIVKEPISTKGPRITAELSIAGRFVVLVPFSNRVSVSQKIRNREEKDKLKNLVRSIKPKGFGVIIRTVAESKMVADLDADLKNLYRKWQIIYKQMKKVKAPAKVLGELGRTASLLRDLLNDDFAKSIAPDLKSLKDLKSRLKENIEKNLDDDYKKRLNDKIIDYFTDKTKFVVPKSMVGSFLENLFENEKQNPKNKNQTIDEKDFKEKMAPYAEKNVKWLLIRNELIDQESITVSDKDISKFIKDAIKANKDQANEIKEFYDNSENKNNLKSNLMTNRLFECLADYAKIKITEKSTDELRENKNEKQ